MGTKVSGPGRAESATEAWATLVVRSVQPFVGYEVALVALLNQAVGNAVAIGNQRKEAVGGFTGDGARLFEFDSLAVGFRGAQCTRRTACR